MLFITQALQKLVEKEDDSLEGPRRAIAMEHKTLCLG